MRNFLKSDSQYLTYYYPWALDCAKSLCSLIQYKKFSKYDIVLFIGYETNTMPLCL